MSSYYARQYVPKTDATSSRTIEESKTKTVLMKDRSWIKLLAEEEADGDDCIVMITTKENNGDYSKTTEPKSFPKLSPISSSTTRASFTSSSNSDDGPVRRTTSYSVSTEPSPEDKLADTLLPKSFSGSLLSSERVIVDKDMCTYCRKPLSPDPKVILDDMKIKCHASCFKCEVCNKPLGHLKAGDSMWVYQRMVHCESCFDVTREKWRY